MTNAIRRRGDFGSDMLRRITDLERRWGIKLGLTQKILLAETGTVEQIVSILVGSTVNVCIREQKEKRGIIQRESHITSRRGKIVITARSEIFARNLPARVIALIRARKMGIGTIIQCCNLETFRRITDLGYDPSTRVLYRKYQIRHNKRVAFNIGEEFPTSQTGSTRVIRTRRGSKGTR